MTSTVEQFIAGNRLRYVEELKAFLSIPSVSTDPAHISDVRHAAEFVRDQLFNAGVSAEIVNTPGHPIVYGEWRGAPGAPTVLIYGHYDVQPPDPLNEWVTPPFEPDIRDGYVYARGATDDKGQMYTHIKSVEAWMKTEGRLPVNVVFVIEGEEEVGSSNLDEFLSQSQERLKSDVAVVSDSSQFAPGIPAITYALRGIVACEIVVRGAKQDMHSGIFGGAVPNVANVLAKVVGDLHDANRHVQIPGFYDDVAPMKKTEREQFANLPFDEASFLKEIGVGGPFGEKEYTTNERRWARPTCDVNGIISGYTGEGVKTVIPAEARVKLSCRLVPNQHPDRVLAGLKEFFQSHLPKELTLDFRGFHGCEAFVFDPKSRYMQAAKTAIEKAFGSKPVMVREGGSIPVVKSFHDILGIDTLLLGWGQNSDNLHSPNERFSLADFQRGTLASAELWHELANVVD